MAFHRCVFVPTSGKWEATLFDSRPNKQYQNMGKATGMKQ